MTEIQMALKKAGIKMTSSKRIWLWLKDHPNHISSQVSTALHINLSTVGSILSNLESRNMVSVATRLNLRAGRKNVKEYCAKGRDYELLPIHKKATTAIAILPSSDGVIKPGFAPKFDAEKIRMDLLPIQPMTDIAEVFTFGAQKYFANSYRQGETVAWSRTYGSILRHLLSFWQGEDKDPESGLAHLAHAGTQLMILMEHTHHNKNKDDRHVRK